jgi:chromate transporter
MTTSIAPDFARHWRDILVAFLRLGATGYGGPAIMGLMQAELQTKRRWVSPERFVEGLSLVNALPGATAVQLSIFLGYARGGWWGGLLGGLCFVLPALFVMLALTIGYASLGLTPIMRGALYGLGPVVLAIFAVAMYRLGRTAIASVPQALIGLAAALALLAAPLGVASILVLSAAAGLVLFQARTPRTILVGVGVAILGLLPGVWWWMAPPVATAGGGVRPLPGLADLAAFFFKVGAFTVGGGLTMVAFIQDQVVEQFHWLTPREFLDGLALGQLTPGPILILAAYVGYKLAGLAGAGVATGAIFLPSFILMLTLLPMLERVRRLTWTKAVMQGVGPAVIGVLAVSLLRLAPHALPDPFAVVVLVASITVLLVWRVGTFQLMLAGSLLGILRSRLVFWPGIKAARALSAWVRA